MRFENLLARRFIRYGCLTAAFIVAMTLRVHGQNEPVWSPVKVPEAWKDPSPEIQSKGQGYAWFRCRFAAPEGWRERDGALLVEAADDAREYFVNGVRVATSGGFPPKYHSGLGSEEFHNLPAKSIRPGAENVLAVRMFGQESRTNFNVAAPVILAGDQAIQMKGDWEIHLGDLAPDQTLAKLDSSSFDKVISAAELQKTWKLLDADEGPLAIEDALKRFQVPEDLFDRVSRW